MKKGRKLIVTALSMVALFGIGVGALVGCGGNGDGGKSQQVEGTYSVEWTVPEHARVTVEGASELPTSVPEDSAISFTVEVDSGYAVDSVKANNKKISLKNEKYTVGITKDTTIVIEVSEAVSDLTVSTKPTKLTYIAGDELDVTGMVVEVTLGTGGKKTLTLGGDDGYTVFPTVFEGGETSFEVTYKKQTIKVDLDSVVEYLVKIDANGGRYTADYLASLEAKNLHNYKQENGVITFTYYNNMSSSVPMPKASDVTNGDSILTGWSYEEASISNNTAANVNAVASWQTELVTLSSCKLVKENNVPYLVIEGEFKAANEVFLYLYEGNAKVELKGDTYTGTTGQKFEVKFDLRRLAEKGADYEGKWMDIRFNASLGAIEESMEIYVNATSTVAVDTGEKLLVDDVAYCFATYSNRLKVYFQQTSLTYEFEGHAVDGKDYLKITGKTKDAAHFNKYVNISVWNGSGETTGYGAQIDGQGNFVVEYAIHDDFSEILKTNIFFHIGIYEDNTLATIIWGGTSQNVVVSSVFTNMPAATKNLGDIHHAARYVGADGLSYYIGYAWDGLMLYVIDEGHEITLENAKVEERNGVVYYVLTGTCSGYTTETFLYGFYFQHINNLDGLGEGDVYDNPAVDQHATVDAQGNFEMVCPVSTLIAPSFKEASDTKWGMIAKYYVGSTESPRIEVKAASFGEDSVTKDGIRYSVYANSSSTWNIDCLVMEKI